MFAHSRSFWSMTLRRNETPICKDPQESEKYQVTSRTEQAAAMGLESLVAPIGCRKVFWTGVFGATLGKISGKSTFAQAIRYALSRWAALTRFTADGRLEMTNNAAERAIRPLIIGRKNWLFAGSDSGGERAAMLYTIIETAKLNGVEPYVYLADVLGRIADHLSSRIDELLPWRWQPTWATA
jgi:hypothetical protein